MKTQFRKDGKDVWHLAPLVAYRLSTFGLLRVCRKIYSETAPLPYSLNTFSFEYQEDIRRHLGSLKPFQRASITRIQFTVNSIGGISCWGCTLEMLVRLFGSKLDASTLPALRCVHVLVFEASLRGDATSEDILQKVERQLEALMAGRDVKVVYEVMETPGKDYRAL